MTVSAWVRWSRYRSELSFIKAKGWGNLEV